MNILVIEKNKKFTLLLQGFFKNFYNIESSINGTLGLEKASVNKYDLILINVTLPDISNLRVCRLLRERNKEVLIVVLTNAFNVEERIKGFEYGADDCLPTTIHYKELIAKIKAFLRIKRIALYPNILTVCDLTIDTDRKVVKRAGKIIFLRKKEFCILEYFVKNKGKVITRDVLLDHIWSSTDCPGSNTIDVHMKYLRDKIDLDYKKKLIKTIHGIGYKIEE